MNAIDIHASQSHLIVEDIQSLAVEVISAPVDNFEILGILPPRNHLSNVGAYRGFDKTRAIIFAGQPIHSFQQTLINCDGSSDFYSSKLIALNRFVKLSISALHLIVPVPSSNLSRSYLRSSQSTDPS